MPAIYPPVSAPGSGSPNQPLIPVRGGPFGNNTEATLGQIMDASFGSTSGATIYRDANSWRGTMALSSFVLQFRKAGALSVANDIELWQIMPVAAVGVYAALCCKTGPVGANLITKIGQSSDGGQNFTLIQTLAITNGSTWNTNALTQSFAQADILRLDVTQVGSGTAGSDLTVCLFLQAVQPLL